MKKLFLILLIFFCTALCFAETNEITIDNASHKIDDYLIVINNTSEIIYMEIFVNRKESSPEQKVGSAIVPPKSETKIKTIVDGQFEAYDFIKVQTSGIIKDYSMHNKRNDVLLTISSYTGPENGILFEEGLKFRNEVLFDISDNHFRDYVFIRNNTDLPIHCLLYGIANGSGKEIYIGKGLINPTTKIHIKTFYDHNLRNLKAIRLRSYVKIMDYDSICSSHDINITIYAAKEDDNYPEPPAPPEEEGTVKDFIYL